MKLDSKFDILRGWPREGAQDESFEVKSGETLASGTVVEFDAGGANVNAVMAATTPDRSTTSPTRVFVVIEGNDDFSGEYVKKVVVVRAPALFRLDPDNFTADAGLVPGAPVTFDAGLWKLAATNDQIIGYVESDVMVPSTVTDTIVVSFVSSGEAML